jgi:hypothetical protein
LLVVVTLTFDGALPSFHFAYAVAFADAGAEKSKSAVYHVEVYQLTNVQLVFVGF